MSPRIMVLVLYFGKWPEWMDLFLETVRRNSDIDFLFVTDCDASVIRGPNAQVREISFDDYVGWVNQRIGFEFAPADGLKLCDLRPVFGMIHQEDFVGHDFYGWCDTDLLFGEVRAFYTNDILARFDVLATHGDRISGHFSLFRNNDRNRDMFRNIYHWQEALRSEQFVGIDEHGITNAYLMTAVDKANEKFGWNIDNFVTRALARWRRRRMYLTEQYSTPFLPKPWLDGTLNSAQPDEWYYRNGRITNSRDGERDFMYLHFMNFKSSRWRHDGTRAPWEGLTKISRATAADMHNGIVINASGITPAGPSTL